MTEIRVTTRGVRIDATNERVVFKYVIPLDDRPTRVVTGTHPKLVGAKCRGSGPTSEVVLWIEHDLHTADLMSFAVHGTGHLIPPGQRHCFTLFQDPFVWHLYEVVE
jgi:hypothetical protein